MLVGDKADWDSSMDQCTKVAVHRFCFAAPQVTQFWGKLLLSCYHSCRILISYAQEKISVPLLPQGQNVSHQTEVLLFCYHNCRMFVTWEKFWCPATPVAKCFCYHSCRVLFVVAEEQNFCLVRNTALVVAQEQKFSLVREKNSATVVAGQQNQRMAAFVHWSLWYFILYYMHADTTKFMLALFSVPGQPIPWKTGIIRSGATRFGHNTNTILPTIAAGSLLIMHSHNFFFSMKICILHSYIWVG